MAKRRTTPRITLSDVAQDAGVSVTTVSLVLNHVQNATISEPTRTRVRASAERLNYRRNAAARQLRTQRSDLIGLITDTVASNPNAGDVIRGAQDAAWSRDKVLMIVNTGADPALAKAAALRLMEHQVDGFLYAADYHQEVVLPAVFSEVPCVLIDCFTSAATYSSVVPDEVDGGFQATSQLLTAGHRRVGFINLEDAVPARVGRLAGYRRALEGAGIPFDADLIRLAGDEIGLPYRQTRELLALSDPPTALFCATDRMAMEAYAAIADTGLRIPRDISVIGFDNQEIVAARLRPGLSTMQLPHYAMGVWAVERLLRTVDGEDVPIEQVSLPCPVVLRGSIARPVR